MDDLPAGTAEHRVAMGRLLQVERRIVRLAEDDVDVSDYLAHLVVWTQAIIVHPLGWTTNSHSNKFPPTASMQMLRALSQLLDSHFKQVRTDNTRLRDLLAEVDKALSEDDSLGDEMRRYLAKLLAKIRATLDDHEYVDGFDLDESLDRLWVTLRAAAYESNDGERWDRVAGFFRDLASGALVNAPSWFLAAHQAHQAIGH